MDFGSFTETAGNSMPSASAASGAIEVFERIFFRIFGEIHGNHRKEHDTQEKRK